MTAGKIELIAEESHNLDTVCYRGAAPLAELARISQADVFDQVLNADGLQRALSLKHAAEAYEYVARPKDRKLPRAFTEVVLNVRDKKVLEREVLHEADGVRLVKLTFDLDAILDEEGRARGVKVSRLDGNHRLVFAAGSSKATAGRDREPLEAIAPFQLHVGLTRDQEAALFSDINANQKGLNTSHLAILRSRITPEDVELEQHPARVFARRLATDQASPWHDLVHMGGSRAGTKEQHRVLPVTFIALEHGVQRTLRKSGYLGELGPDPKYGLIRAYWQAVQAVYPEAWAEPREYLVLKNIGVQAFSLLGATVIDRCLIANNVEVGHMVPFLLAAKPRVNWHKESRDIAGMSGNRAALLLAGELAKDLPTVADSYIEPADALKEPAAV